MVLIVSLKHPLNHSCSSSYTGGPTSASLVLLPQHFKNAASSRGLAHCFGYIWVRLGMYVKPPQTLSHDLSPHSAPTLDITGVPK